MDNSLTDMEPDFYENINKEQYMKIFNLLNKKIKNNVIKCNCSSDDILKVESYLKYLIDNMLVNIDEKDLFNDDKILHSKLIKYNEIKHNDTKRIIDDLKTKMIDTNNIIKDLQEKYDRYMRQKKMVHIPGEYIDDVIKTYDFIVLYNEIYNDINNFTKIKPELISMMSMILFDYFESDTFDNASGIMPINYIVKKEITEYESEYDYFMDKQKVFREKYNNAKITDDDYIKWVNNIKEQLKDKLKVENKIFNQICFNVWKLHKLARCYRVQPEKIILEKGDDILTYQKYAECYENTKGKIVDYNVFIGFQLDLEIMKAKVMCN